MQHNTTNCITYHHVINKYYKIIIHNILSLDIQFNNIKRCMMSMIRKNYKLLIQYHQ